MSIQGCATPDGTQRYAERCTNAAPEHFRVSVDGFAVGSIGMGTYRGDADDATDARYRDAVQQALAGGCNHIDTAINARYQRSERAIGQALRDAFAQGIARRDEVIIATKGGYVPFDGARPDDPRRWVYEHYIESGLAHPNEFAANYTHCFAPDFLDAMIDRSRANLGVETIDVYYLHNPETQRISNTHETFRRRMLDAFETLEAAVERGHIGAYGLATWSALRGAPDTPDFLSLTELVGLAFQVAGNANHLRYMQLPYNLMMTEAYILENQQVGEGFYSAIGAADALGLNVITSAALKQGLLASPFMADLSPYFPTAETDAQRAIQFARSTPGILSVLVGMSQPAHVAENLALAALPPSDPDVIDRLYDI